eukprot:jgi/Orpsp1_1/1176476/evm.model.c7180000057769.1
MSQETKLQNEERLNKNNFDEWEFLISNILKSKKILKYVQSDIIGNLKEKLEEEKRKSGQREKPSKIIKDLETKIEDAEFENALACTIISTNVSKEILEYIKRINSAYDIMQKLKTLYGKKKSSDVQYWMRKMYSLKAKNLSECKDVINQIKEIFNIMTRNNANLGVWKKTRILYLSFPKILRDQIHPDGTQTMDEFLNEITNKINFHIYLHSTIDFNKNIKSNEDLMDIDFIEHGKKNNHVSKPSSS